MYGLRLTAATILLCSCAEPLFALDCGLWNVPGNAGQFCGKGFGAGHHAPMVRAPHRHPPHVARVEFERSQRQCTPACYACAHPTCHMGGCVTGQCGGVGYRGGYHTQPAPACHQTPTPALQMQNIAPSIFGPPQEPSTPAPAHGMLPTPQMPTPEPAVGR